MNSQPVGKGRFAKGGRVRIKFGANRGCYGTIVHVGGDDGTYYGVMLDADTVPIGYSDYELDFANGQ